MKEADTATRVKAPSRDPTDEMMAEMDAKLERTLAVFEGLPSHVRSAFIREYGRSPLVADLLGTQLSPMATAFTPGDRLGSTGPLSDTGVGGGTRKRVF